MVPPILGSLLTALVPMLMLAGDLTGLLTPLLLSFLCFCFGVCNGLVIANAMICSMRAAGRNSGAGTGLLGAMQMLFGGVAGSAIIALGGADHFSVTATGLLIMAYVRSCHLFWRQIHDKWLPSCDGFDRSPHPRMCDQPFTVKIANISHIDVGR